MRLARWATRPSRAPKALNGATPSGRVAGAAAGIGEAGRPGAPAQRGGTNAPSGRPAADAPLRAAAPAGDYLDLLAQLDGHPGRAGRLQPGRRAHLPRQRAPRERPDHSPLLRAVPAVHTGGEPAGGPGDGLLGGSDRITAVPAHDRPAESTDPRRTP